MEGASFTSAFGASAIFGKIQMITLYNHARVFHAFYKNGWWHYREPVCDIKLLSNIEFWNFKLIITENGLPTLVAILITGSPCIRRNNMRVIIMYFLYIQFSFSTKLLILFQNIIKKESCELLFQFQINCAYSPNYFIAVLHILRDLWAVISDTYLVILKYILHEYVRHWWHLNILLRTTFSYDTQFFRKSGNFLSWVWYNFARSVRTLYISPQVSCRHKTSIF
jgi:hypothetical protein